MTDSSEDDDLPEEAEEVTNPDMHRDEPPEGG